MPDIHFPCSSCGARLVIDAAAAGCGIDCPHCRAAVTVPDAFAVSTEREIEPLRTRSAELEAEVLALREALAKAEASRQAAAGELDKARTWAAEGAAALAGLEAARTELEGKLETAEKAAAAKADELEKASARLAEAQATASGLEGRLRSLEAKARAAGREDEADRKVRDDLRRQLDELRDLKKRLAEKEAESHVFAQQKQDWLEERARQASFLEEVKKASANLMRENQELKDRLAVQPSETQAGVAREAAEDEARIEALAKENAELKARLRVMSAGLRHRV